MTRLSMDISIPYHNLGLDWRILVSIPAVHVAQSGTLKTDGLSHSQFLKILLYFLYRFLTFHFPREILLDGPGLLQARTIWSMTDRVPWTPEHHAGPATGQGVWCCSFSVPPTWSEKCHHHPPSTPAPHPIATLTMLEYFPGPFAGTWQLNQ